MATIKTIIVCARALIMKITDQAEKKTKYQTELYKKRTKKKRSTVWTVCDVMRNYIPGYARHVCNMFFLTATMELKNLELSYSYMVSWNAKTTMVSAWFACECHTAMAKKKLGFNALSADIEIIFFFVIFSLSFFICTDMHFDIL